VASPDTIPQGLKPRRFSAEFGTAEAVPFQNSGLDVFFPQAVKPCLFQMAAWIFFSKL
jgi:hypothetical protein